MSVSRRGVLRGIMTAAAAAVGGGVVGRIVRSTNGAVSSPTTAGGPALSVDGHLMHQHGGSTKMTMPPAAEPTGRQGVAGRKWVMVLDLSRCDGCGKCTEACGKMHLIPPDRQWIPVLVMRDNATAGPYYFPSSLLPLRPAPLHQGLPRERHLQDAGWHRAGGQRTVHRLPLLHCRLSV